MNRFPGCRRASSHSAAAPSTSFAGELRERIDALALSLEIIAAIEDALNTRHDRAEVPRGNPGRRIPT